jgi:hypothetical protein
MEIVPTLSGTNWSFNIKRRSVDSDASTECWSLHPIQVDPTARVNLRCMLILVHKITWRRCHAALTV